MAYCARETRQEALLSSFLLKDNHSRQRDERRQHAECIGILQMSIDQPFKCSYDGVPCTSIMHELEPDLLPLYTLLLQMKNNCPVIRDCGACAERADIF